MTEIKDGLGDIGLSESEKRRIALKALSALQGKGTRRPPANRSMSVVVNSNVEPTSTWDGIRGMTNTFLAYKKEREIPGKRNSFSAANNTDRKDSLSALRRAVTNIESSRRSPQLQSKGVSKPTKKANKKNNLNTRKRVESEEVDSIYLTVYDSSDDSFDDDFDDDTDTGQDVFPPGHFIPPPIGETVDPENSYHITIETGGKLFAGTDCHLSMVFTDMSGYVYDAVKIDNDGTMFARNTTYEQKIIINANTYVPRDMTRFKEG